MKPADESRSERLADRSPKWEVAASLVGFGRALRQAGLTVGTDRVLSYCRGLALAPDADIYWVGRATLVGRHQDVRTYDEVFRSYFAGIETPKPPPHSDRVALVASDLQISDLAGDAPDGMPERSVASGAEILRTKSFSSLSEEELRELARLMTRLRLVAPLRRTRRRERARAGDPDLRRTLRQAFRTGGEPIERSWRNRRRKRRRLVLVLDVSGSMSAYSRALVVFAYAAMRADPRLEVFSFGTRLTRLTWALAAAEPDEALRRAAAEAIDWDGGTRTGTALKELIDRWGKTGALRGSIVVIASDGLDVGDPQLLADQMARLRRLAHRVVWLNPLKESSSYAPLARGMKAALPHVDLFASGHDLANLEEVAETIGAM